ncbi:hypothetical protein Pcinc_015915 [Petrolisthes cinctipes]|uniref:Uncharacterized protein n=1 Tax=Petrolisthes cinctipes TaxID=88211 RepID=A0AAE1FS31_PETCI|nr:hypothetical protein Pcinc_015915 [Petrolisthes cinctipes]
MIDVKSEKERQNMPPKEENRNSCGENESDEDPWALAKIDEDKDKWDDMTTKEKLARIIINILKVTVVLGFLYLFICSLDFLSSAFRLIAGKTTSDILSNQFVQNPIVGLMIGILVTVLVQSSSTSTSIIVSMVSAGMLSVHTAIPMILGSNIGTSVTNTIVSLTQVGDRNEFRRAFAGATVHDMFNWLSVITFLIIELITGVLEYVSGALVSDLSWVNGGGEVKILKYITEPFTKVIIQLDKDVLHDWSLGTGCLVNETSLIKRYCKKDKPDITTEFSLTTVEGSTTVGPYLDCEDYGIPHSCKFLFYETSMTDAQVGIILLVGSLFILCAALITIVKILNSMMKGKMAMIIKTTINANIPYMPWLTGYIALLVGAVMTFIVQSSSIFTSTLTPLIGIGVITIERSYPLTLGSNIGTTTTALLASMAGEGEGLKDALQIAFVHLFFNIFGILLFYPIPFMRFPIPLAKKLGDTTAKYRWFAVVYLVVMFFFLPGFVFILSLGGAIVLYVVGIPLVVVLVLSVIINILQVKKPSFLPKVLRTWNWLPKPLHSLQPYDACCIALPCCKSCRESQVEMLKKEEELHKVKVTKDDGKENQAFEGTDTKF